ncbi:MAG: hypothetical protein D6758_11420 [Gammaproteobacteria bacterium]|nr:MAG: hypothetical protein D6758_11420 [Gammaproteobacteria bacterium]
MKLMQDKKACIARGESLSWLDAAGSPEWFYTLKPDVVPDQIDVILITHPRSPADLTCFFPWADRLDEADQDQLLRCLRPLLLEVVRIPGLTAGMMFLPVHAGDMLNPRRTPVARHILMNEAFPLATRFGAKVVCLGGLNGALSRYGKRLLPLARGTGTEITIGHSVTVVCVWETVLKALAETGQHWRSRSVALIGMGGIGEGLLNLMALRGQWPGRLMLVDRPRQRGRMEQLVRDMRIPASCPVNIVEAPPGEALPFDHPAYSADVLVTATSQANVIDIDDVRPGTILVDDSQPHCWSREAARKRVLERGDILPCDTGLVDCSALHWFSRFDFGFAGDEEARTVAWSCLVEGLLKGLDPSLPCTLGHPDRTTLMAWDEAFHRCGLRPAPLQCGGLMLPVAAIREQFRVLDLRSGIAPPAG